MALLADPRTMNSLDLVEYLHPVDEPGRQHTITAAYQAKDLLRYLADVTRETPAEALPAGVVAGEVVLAVRDGLPFLAELLRNLGEWTQSLMTPDAATHQAACETAATLEQAAENLAGLWHLLDDAADRGAQVWRGR